MKNKIKIYLLLFFVIALGFFLRFYGIEHVPPGVYPDEAMNGEDAYKANLSGNYQLFYSANEGREGLFINLIALCFKFFGISILTLKLPSIIFGTLTILGTYLLVKELFQKERPAIISAFLISTAYWSINFSRIAFRANMLPFVLVFSFYFVFRGIRTKKWFDFAIGGIIFGVGSHSYIAWRIAPLILIILLIAFILSKKSFLKEYWKFIAIFIFFSTAITAPIAYELYSHSNYLHAPIDDISIFSPLINHGQPFLTFLKSLGLSLIKFNFVGDQNWRHNYPPYPVIDPLTGIAFLFGLIYSLIKLKRLIADRFFRQKIVLDLIPYSFLIFWFFIMLSPEFLTGEGLPHALRSIGTLPVVFIFSALAFEYLFSRAERLAPSRRKIIQVLLILVLVFIGLFNSIKYFYFLPKNPRAANSFDKNLTDISSYLKTLPAQKEKFVVNSFGPYHSPLDRLPIQIFNLDLPNLTYLYSWQNFDQIRPKSDDFIVILTGKDSDTEARLKIRFPNLILEEINPSPGSVYYVLQSN